LCCDGVLHAQTVVKPDEIEHVRALGLTVETVGETAGFRQPCPLYRDQGCSVHPGHPATCRAYRCALLTRYLAGTITREQGAETVRRARELVAAVLERLPAGYSFAQVRREFAENWDSGRGIIGSAEWRLANAGYVLAAAKLAMYTRKHFGKPQGITVK
jgi:hypothetical protein